MMAVGRLRAESPSITYCYLRMSVTWSPAARVCARVLPSRSKLRRRYQSNENFGALAEKDAAVPPKPVPDMSAWRKASYSIGNGECVEVARSADGLIGVRDSKAPAGGIITMSTTEWKSFLSGVGK